MNSMTNPPTGGYIYARIWPRRGGGDPLGVYSATGEWEVQTSHGELCIRAGYSWRLHRICDSEMAAERLARSLLPFCDSDWAPKRYYTSWDLWLNETKERQASEGADSV